MGHFVCQAWKLLLERKVGVHGDKRETPRRE